MNCLVRLARVAVPSALCLACGVPVDDSKYEVHVDPPPPAERIVEAFADDNDGCDACLRSSCMNKITPCVDTPACTEFAECVQQEADPAGQARCSSQERHVTLHTVAAFSDVRTCWAVSCKAACGVGKDWSCLDNYEETQPPRSTATVRQSFRNLCNNQVLRGANVQYCDDAGVDCFKRGVTDDSGTYTQEVPTPVSGALVGWRGFRWVSGGGLGLFYRLRRNLPIWSDLVESTALVGDDCVSKYLEDLGSTDDSNEPIDWMRAMAVQVFDCQSTGADAVVLKVTTAPQAKIRYAKTLGTDVTFERDSSKATGEGLVLVANLPDGEHEFKAYESDRLIGRGSAYISAVELNVFSIFPEPVPAQ